MQEVVSHFIKLFADDSKLIAIIRNDNDLDILEQDLDALTDWSDEWRMLFNVEKSKIMGSVSQEGVNFWIKSFSWVPWTTEKH